LTTDGLQEVGMIESRDAGAVRDHVALGALSRVFLQVSLCGFGGGLALAHRIVVDERQWLPEPEFADIVSLCQFLPGPNIIGIAVCTGTRLRGAAGALAAAAGFLVIPWGLGLAAGLLLLAHAQHPLLQQILGGLSATAAGLLIATGIRLLLPHRRRPAAIGFAVLAFGLVTFGKLPLLIVLFGLVPISITVVAVETVRAR
jgi:chromate transporter